MGQSNNPIWIHIREWALQVHKPVWDMISVLWTAIPILIGAVKYFIWATSAKANPPLPIWCPILIGLGIILFGIFSFLAFRRVSIDRDSYKRRLENTKLKENTELEADLIIIAKVAENPNLGITERMSIALPIATDTLRTIEIGLKIKQPLVINKLYLEIWGQKIESIEFPHLRKFNDNELIEQSGIFQAGFSIPKMYAIDDPTAKIYIFANNNEYRSNPFPITFGDSK